MNTRHPAPSTQHPVPTAADCAEAAAWIAKLHGEDRTTALETGLRRWLNESPAHRAAFDMANEVWATAERLPRPRTPIILRWPNTGLVMTWPRALTATILLAIAVTTLGYTYYYDPGITTRIGEQRNITLTDGTRISLNTDTKIHQHYDAETRHIQLDHGEALFEVAKNKNWPFIVTAGGKQVTALGTSFVVKLTKSGEPTPTFLSRLRGKRGGGEDAHLAVTLVEGKVTVSPANSSPSLPRHETHSSSSDASQPVVRPRAPQHDDAQQLTKLTTSSVISLSPGQRLTFRKTNSERSEHMHSSPGQERLGEVEAVIDTPPIDTITAWQHGQIILDHTPLRDAITEMNRYSPIQIECERSERLDSSPDQGERSKRLAMDGQAGLSREAGQRSGKGLGEVGRDICTLQVTGIFRIGDTADFAAAVAKTYNLQITQQPDRIFLTSAPTNGSAP